MDMTLMAGNCFGENGYAVAVVIGSVLGLAAGLYRPRRTWVRIRHAQRATAKSPEPPT